MGIAWTNPTPEGPRVEGLIYWAKGKDKTYFLPLAAPVAVWMHYTPVGSRPHEDADCPHCPRQLDKKGYLPALVLTFDGPSQSWSWRKGVFELTANALYDWSEDLIGCVCEAARHGGVKNGKVSIALAERTFGTAIPPCEPFDVLPILLRAWGMIDRRGVLKRPPSQVLPLRRASNA